MLDIWGSKSQSATRKGTCRMYSWKQCIRKLAYGIWKVLNISDGSTCGDWTFKAAQPFSKWKHSRVQNLPEKSLKPCSSPLVKIIILLSICTAKYVGIKHSVKSINDVCRVFQRPFACMNDSEIKQICTRANKLFLHVFFLGLWTEHITYYLTKL